MSSTDFESLQQKLASLDQAQIRDSFHAANEFLQIENFLPTDITQGFIDDLAKLDDAIHRNFIPKHKKGGSVSRFDLDKRAERFRRLYEYQPLNEFFSFLANKPLLQCPQEDPHTYALYYYSWTSMQIRAHQ